MAIVWSKLKYTRKSLVLISDLLGKWCNQNLLWSSNFFFGITCNVLLANIKLAYTDLIFMANDIHFFIMIKSIGKYLGVSKMYY